MTSNQSNPPKLALWWLRHACPGEHIEALTGDLIERFREGSTRLWFWRQVLIAFTTSVLGEIRRRWTFFCYAAAGTVAMCIAPVHPVTRISVWLHWSDLPWPLSQFVFELNIPALVTFDDFVRLGCWTSNSAFVSVGICVSYLDHQFCADRDWPLFDGFIPLAAPAYSGGPLPQGPDCPRRHPSPIHCIHVSCLRMARLSAS